MFLAKGPPNFMLRLSRFPAIPDLTLLDRRKPKPFPWSHVNTTSGEKIYISGVASTYRMHRVNQALRHQQDMAQDVVVSPYIYRASKTRSSPAKKESLTLPHKLM